MHVLQVYYEPQPSGQTAHVLSLARGLDPGRYRLTVVVPEALTRSIAAFEELGVSVVPLPLRKTLWPPRALAAFVRLVRNSDVDVVHVHSQEAGLLARVVARMAGARAILYTPQTIDIRRVRWHGLYVGLERALSHATDVIVSVNEADRQRLIGWGIPSHKVVTVPNGVDLARFEGPVEHEALRQALGLEAGRPLVMQVGRLSAQKDPLAFVEGAARVVQACPEAQFALVGDGPLWDPVTARIRALGLEGCVHLAGWRDEAFRFMAAADVVTLTSRWEGTPYALLEAMAWSRPVVATAVNGSVEVVLDGASGYLVPPGDPAAWAGRVTALLGDPEQSAAMGRQGRRRVEERYTLQQTVARIGKLYLQVAGRDGT